jgi:hypothetical protein
MYKILIFIFFLIQLPSYLNASNTFTPDSYTKNGFCIVTSQLLKHKGLTIFTRKEEFNKKCNGKMIFQYKNHKCRWFSMKNMKFNIFIGNGKSKVLFSIGQRKKICSKEVVEEI